MMAVKQKFLPMPRYDLALRYALLSSTMYCVNLNVFNLKIIFFNFKFLNYI